MKFKNNFFTEHLWTTASEHLTAIKAVNYVCQKLFLKYLTGSQIHPWTVHFCKKLVNSGKKLLVIGFFLVRLQDFGMKRFLQKTSISDACVNSPFFAEYLFYGTTVIMKLQLH